MQTSIQIHDSDDFEYISLQYYSNVLNLRFEQLSKGTLLRDFSMVRYQKSHLQAYRHSDK